VQVSTDKDSPGRSLNHLLQVEQVRLAIEQVKRIPPTHFFVDLCLSWTAAKAGMGRLVLPWLVAITIAQVGRSAYLVWLDKSGKLRPDQMLLRLAIGLCVLGGFHALLMILVFAYPVSSATYLLTMILVGNAAGAVSPAAGHLRSYIAFGVVFGGTLMACWMRSGGTEGVAIGLLVAALFSLLTLYVRDQGRALLQLVSVTESLRLERDRAERASQAKTRFFAAASHDLRQPLTALSYNAATVQALAASRGDDVLMRVGNGIARALTESGSLLDSLLEVSELDAGAVKVNWEVVDVDALLDEICATCAPLAESRGLELRAESDDRRRACALADLSLLRRILHNLVGNALKFTVEGGVVMRVDHDDAESERFIVIQVSDTGPGIPLDAQEHVFEEFFQVGNVERDRSRGLGLGLAIVRRLASLLGGTISLHSDPGHGATFRLAIARHVARPEAPWPTVSNAQAPAPTMQRAHAVLVIDDESAIRDGLTLMLTTLGWEVGAVADAASAIEQWTRGFRPAAIIVDFRLRDGASGLDALQALRALGCDAPALMVTGDTAPDRITQARSAGIPVMYKPVDGMELAGRLAQLANAGAPA
jgi:signal transduction histidine kinase